MQPPPSPVEALVQRMDARARGESPGDGVPTGFPSLDRMLGGGLRRQDLIVLGGDVGSGKSSLALAIALRSVKAGYPVAYLSGEMSEERLMERALAQEARVSVDALRGGELDDVSRAAVGAAAVRLRGLPLVIQPLAGERFAEVAEALETVPRRSLLILDDVQMTASPVNAPSAEERTAATVRDLPRRDVSAELRRGGRGGTHHREEPQRPQRVRGPLLLPQLAPVRGHARPRPLSLTPPHGFRPAESTLAPARSTNDPAVPSALRILTQSGGPSCSA